MESRNANSSRIGCRSKLSRPVISKGEPSEKGRPSLEQIPSQLSKKSRLRKPPSETTFMPPSSSRSTRLRTSASSTACNICRLTCPFWYCSRTSFNARGTQKAPAISILNGGNTFAMFILSLIIIIMILLPQYHEQQSNTIEWQQEVLSRTKNLK